MTPDWSRVALEHIHKACELYDSGTSVPKRAAKSTFLNINGKTYPAKFIRGLAYHLATGVDLDPSRDYSGGLETIKFFESLGLATTSSVASPTPSAPVSPKRNAEKISKIALVSHDYNITDSQGRYDYSEHFARINRLCDEQGCDTILYALYTWDRESSVSRNHDTFFGGLNYVQRLILEVGQPAIESFDHVEVWQRGEAPLLAKQRFATSTASATDKQAFLDDLPQRKIQDALLMICGETNIASLVRGSDDFYDPYSFTDRLADMNVRLVVNPVHDYMRRYEMREKRRYYSGSGRTVISVWNQGKGKEAYLPWNVFHDGIERTEDVVELVRPFDDRPDIRIGIFCLKGLEKEPRSS